MGTSLVAQKKIFGFKRLPVLSAVLVRLIDACADENISLQEISRLIAADPGLTTRVLYLANSAFCRTYQQIEHIDQAVLCIGKKMLKNVILSAAVNQVFKFEDGLDRKWVRRFWRHSLLTALISSHIAQKTDYKDREQAFLAGLLHDIGRLLLYVNFPDAYQVLLNEELYEWDTFLNEEAKLAAPHPEVAAEILSEWKLDTFVVDAVLYHHEPVEKIARSFPLVKITYSANVLAKMTETSKVRCEPVMKLLGLSTEETTSIIVAAETEREEMAQSLGIHIDGSEEAKKFSLLRSHVEDMAGMFAPMEALIAARDESEIVTAVHDGVRALCDVPEVMLFLVDPAKKVLVSHGDPYSRSVSIPMGQVNSLMGRCLKNREIVTSFDVSITELTIMDKQLIHRLGKEGIVFVPLVSLDTEVGIAAFGINGGDQGNIQKAKPMLRLLASVGASALQTERLKRNQAKRIQEERLAAVNNLMRRVAHEINNPLSIIKNFLSILSSRLGEVREGQKEMRIISEELDRISRILPELSIKSETQVRERSRLDVDAVVGDLLNIITPIAARKGIEVAWNKDPSLPNVYADRDGVKQIIVNLVKNSMEALEWGGKITIETRQEQRVGDDGVERCYVVIEIIDNGPGIDPKIQATLFEPCVSTKGNGHAGIGLSVVYQLVKEAGGEITCTSERGKGTRFTVFLPARNDNSFARNYN